MHILFTMPTQTWSRNVTDQYLHCCKQMVGDGGWNEHFQPSATESPCGTMTIQCKLQSILDSSPLSEQMHHPHHSLAHITDVLVHHCSRAIYALARISLCQFYHVLSIGQTNHCPGPWLPTQLPTRELHAPPLSKCFLPQSPSALGTLKSLGW